MLDDCAGGGGGGGEGMLGGGVFSGILPEGGGEPPESTTTPFVPPSPFQQGQTVEAVSGYVLAFQHIYVDGTQALEVYLSSDPWENYDGFGQYWQARLESLQLESLSQLNNLAIKVWGRVDGVDFSGYPVIKLERFEEAYPGLRLQTWQGAWRPVTLEGKEVLLFTTEDGSQYVLSGSLQSGKEGAIGVQGDEVIIQGLAEPGKSYGSYPVITELAGGIAQLGETTVFQDQSLSVIDDREAWVDLVSTTEVQGEVRVTQVELVYAAASLQQCGSVERVDDPALAPWLYVQPVWRFTGIFEDGRTFEVQVQALIDEYLSE